MKDSFLNYLEEFDTNQMNKKIEEKKQEIKKPKILALKVEIASIEGANVVIEKIQDWISRQQPIQEKVEVKKAPYKIPPKKEVTSPILEVKNRAIDILDGLPEDNSITINEESIKNSINISETKNFQQEQKFESVANHASALL